MHLPCPGCARAFDRVCPNERLLPAAQAQLQEQMLAMRREIEKSFREELKLQLSAQQA